MRKEECKIIYKNKKGEKFVTYPVFDKLYDSYLTNISKYYRPGHYDRLREHPDLWKQLLAFEKQLHIFWGNNLSAFKTALKGYYLYQKEAFEGYNFLSVPPTVDKECSTCRRNAIFYIFKDKEWQFYCKNCYETEQKKGHDM